MGERLIKPYEISVWEDKLTQDGFEEIKLAVIGADTMTGLNKVYNPVFHKKVNGEKTLSFSLKYKYFDPYSGNNNVVNPFAALLTNERKVKLKYGKDDAGQDQWYEFIVKDHTESSDGLEWTYTCSDAFILELSKQGYNLTFDSELNNNQGTAHELACAVVKDTDWQIGGTNIGRQYIAEPIYLATINSVEGISIINTDNTSETIHSNEQVYLFYNYIKNQDGKFIQFIIRDMNRPYTIDDKNVITDTNFRIETELVYAERTVNNEIIKGFWKKTNNNYDLIIIIGVVETQYQANRLVYNQLTTYDPIMGYTVDRFKIDSLDIYRYKNDVYTTSNVVTNFITNGDNFNALEDGSLQGWNPYVETTGTINKLELITNPELGTGKALANLDTLSQIEGYLKVQFPGSLTGNYQNAIYNSGIENNASIIHSIAKGDKFVFRWRATKNINSFTSATGLRLLVAKYTQDTPTFGYYYKHIQPNDIILQFNTGTPQKLDNFISGGILQDNNKSYVIDGIPQTPSTKYIYKVGNVNYVWDKNSKSFVANGDYLSYYYLIAEAKQAVSNVVLTDPTQKIGVFLYTIEDSQTYYIQDIQLTRYVEDANGQPVLIGNTPEATSTSIEYYYVKPVAGTAAEDVKTYTSPSELKEDLGIAANKEVKPLYNENSEKYLSISTSQSNCFNILQTIAETFECWIDLVVEHDEHGYITFNDDGRPNKYIYLKEYIGNDNWAGFKYGINLQSIERNINSDEIVTKLIVDQSQSDYVEKGYVSIADAVSNQSGESYILNFDYYYNQGLLDRETAEWDKTHYYLELAEINRNIQAREKERYELEESLTILNSQRNVFTELITTAQNTQTESLEEFEKLKKQSYESYQAQHTTLEPSEQLTEEETILNVLGKIYSSSAIINNYSGLLTNIDQEYWRIRKLLRGSENYNVRVWSEKDKNQVRHIFVELNDYLTNFSFQLSNSSERYTSTVSKKYFDIEINNNSNIIITFMPPSGYSMDTLQYTVTRNEAKFKIISNSTQEGIDVQIEDLIESKNRLIRNFENQYSRFIQEGTWNSTDYIDSELYYLDAVQISNISSQPTVSYTINAVEVSRIEGLEDYLFDTGDKTYIEDIEFFGWANKNGNLTPAREEVIVSEVEWHLDSPDQNVITVQNYKTRFEDLFQRVSATVQTVQYNEATYAKISTLLDANGTINQNVLLSSLNNISGLPYNLTSDGSIRIDGDQITVRNLTNAANVVIINSEGIRISSDGGQHWQTAISGRGIDAGAVYTGSLNTDNVIIGNKDNPSFRWDKSGISAYGSVITTNTQGQEVETYDLQKYVRYDQYGLYGIKNGEFFKAQNLQDVLDNAHFAVTWDGFFIKNSYEGGGRVEITSDNDFRVLNTPLLESEEQEKIKIGALEWEDINGDITIDPLEGVGAPTLYGIRINNDVGDVVLKTGDDGNITITGTINANAGDFKGWVAVGDRTQNPLTNPWIIISGGVTEAAREAYGSKAVIKTSNYQDGAGSGWLINSDGDAFFNNITARGAIKTAIFEYAEIQAVGGIFIFRPSSTIRAAIRVGQTDDIQITVEKPYLFKVGDWCKISNYTDSQNEPIATSIMSGNGLTHVYKIKSINANNSRILILENAYTELTSGNIKVINSLNELVGGALVDMGNKANGNGKVGTNNYGIGINSSDNVTNLPPRAISLFETIVDETQNPKVTYNYRGILGTLPNLSANQVRQSIYPPYMAGTQGIYTDNMYIGDGNQYLAFYTDNNGDKHLRISARDLVFGYDPNTGEEITWDEHIDEQIPIRVEIESSNGNMFLRNNVQTQLTCTVYKGNEDITNTVTRFNWSKKNSDGTVDPDWSRLAGGRTIIIGTEDVASKAIFTCTVEF